ncbi:TSUP family transporter [Prosthecomicrobium sp. N25]|uniref:TSUP family transporter n=1 Tax=Prosthecomicrobium sp. N25 TaxID=3129254 RepID=UPI003076D1E4
MITPQLLAGLVLLVLGTSFLAGVLGMAGGMILMGVLLVVLPVPAAMVLHAVTQMSSNGWRALLWGRYVDWGILARYTVGLAVALAAFWLVRLVPDRAVVLLVLGLSPFLVMALPERLAVRADRRFGAEACGLICSALQYLSGVSGPTLDLFFVRTTLDRRAVVATKAACQVVTHLSRLVYFGGVAGPEADLGGLVYGLAVAAAIAGTSLSRAVLDRITDAQFRVWTRRVVLALGAVYVAQGLHALMTG